MICFSVQWRTIAGGILLAAGCAIAAPDDRFLGGAVDGYALAEFHQFAAVSSPRFLGGAVDGYALAEFRQFAVVSSPRFLGGTVDGYSRDVLTQYEASSSPHQVAPRFNGGSKDGHDRQALLQYVFASAPQSTGPRFRGGPLDGIARDGVTGVTNPLNFDTDGDGLVDWWEAIYFNDLAILHSSGNHDLDGANDGDEFVADTNPDDSNSYFHVTAISNLPPIVIYFESSSNRLYGMEHCSNLVNGVWTNVPGSKPRRGVGGSDSMQDTNSPPRGPFYRLEVELP